MQRVYIWGAGYYADFIYSVIDKSTCRVEGVVDSDSEKQGKIWKYGLYIFAPDILNKINFDYIFISPRSYAGIEKQCRDMRISKDKIIIYWRDYEAAGLFENRANRVLTKEKECIKYRNRWLNAPYEWGIKNGLAVKSSAELLNHIIACGCSLCRYGDGEFEIMLHRERPWFQNVDTRLAERLRKIINVEQENVIIAVADNFGNLEKYTEAAADGIREYMVLSREDVSKLINTEHVFFNAYVSRPYIMYRDKKHADNIFELFKKIWNGRDVLLVEGETARIGVGNDLFQKAKGIRRIICPERNAWKKYKNILNSVKESISYDTLICISLGPTATVLAYDLAIAGYQALDIGQLDNEYEWYIRGAERRIPIEGKMVAETRADGYEGKEKESIDGEESYNKQIIVKI